MIKLIGQFQCTRQQADANTVNVLRQATVISYNKTGNKVPFYCSLIDQLLTLITLGVRVVLLSLPYILGQFRDILFIGTNVVEPHSY